MALADQRSREFRHDINALRALAVSVVALFHFGIPHFSGGFVGVDVFFVISGFLMTLILVGRMDRGTFGLLDFYYDRTKRIVPALAVMVVILVAVVALFADPIVVAKTGRYAISALLFVSNFVFAAEDGYFAEGAGANWLLHTWTLSVEWQFYLLYPFVIWLASRFPPLWKHRLPALIIATIILCAATVFIARRDNVYLQLSFYLLPTRAWELLAGGCVALAPSLNLSSRARYILQGTGFLLIAWAVVDFGPTTPWPSSWTLVPVLGAVAVILSHCAPSVGLIRSSPVQAIGTWSYSIYLWHWPLIVGAKYFFDPVDHLTIVIVLVLSIAIGAISYELVEARLRDAIFAARPAGGWQRFIVPVAAVGVICVVALGLLLSDGLDRIKTRSLPPDTQAVLTDLKKATTDWVGENCSDKSRVSLAHRCRLGKAGGADVAIVGDSHVLQTIARYADQNNIPPGRRLSFLFRNGCPPLPGVSLGLPGMHCASSMQGIEDALLKEHFRRIVFISAWDLYFDDSDRIESFNFKCVEMLGRCRQAVDRDDYDHQVSVAFANLGELAGKLRSAGAQVVFVGVEPHRAGVSATSLYAKTFLAGRPVLAPALSRAEFDRSVGLVRRNLENATARAGVELIEPETDLCGPDDCPLYDDGRFLFRDSSHVRASLIRTERYRYLDAVFFGDAGPSRTPGDQGG